MEASLHNLHLNLLIPNKIKISALKKKIMKKNFLIAALALIGFLAACNSNEEVDIPTSSVDMSGIWATYEEPYILMMDDNGCCTDLNTWGTWEYDATNNSVTITFDDSRRYTYGIKSKSDNCWYGKKHNGLDLRFKSATFEDLQKMGFTRGNRWIDSERNTLHDNLMSLIKAKNGISANIVYNADEETLFGEGFKCEYNLDIYVGDIYDPETITQSGDILFSNVHDLRNFKLFFNNKDEYTINPQPLDK